MKVLSKKNRRRLTALLLGLSFSFRGRLTSGPPLRTAWLSLLYFGGLGGDEDSSSGDPGRLAAAGERWVKVDRAGDRWVGITSTSGSGDMELAPRI